MTQRTSTYLDQFDEDTLPSMEQCVLTDGETVRFTPIGLRRYRERFARAGIDIRALKTREQLQRALAASFAAEMQAFAELVRSRPGARTERQLLAAIALGDRAEIERLSGILKRRRRLGLKLVTPGEA